MPGYGEMVKLKTDRSEQLLQHWPRLYAARLHAALEDVVVTRQLDEAGKLLGVEVLDHLMLGTGAGGPWANDSWNQMGKHLSYASCVAFRHGACGFSRFFEHEVIVLVELRHRRGISWPRPTRPVQQGQRRIVLTLQRSG